MTDEPDALDVLAELSDDDLDRVHRHLIMMRGVHKAVLYDTAYETTRIEAIRREQRRRCADQLIKEAEADHMYDQLPPGLSTRPGS